jgi:nascent polypeptide-associated complex subunit alpha
MLKSMGIDIEELEGVKEVLIRMPDKDIVISNAQVAIMDAHGVRSFQISGDVSERAASPGSVVQDEHALEEPVPEIPDSDIELVAAQTGAKAEDAKAALVEAKGDLAAAIMKLSAK